MHSSKILVLVAIGLLCTNARVTRKKIRQRIATPSCGSPRCSLESTYGCFGTCNCQNIFLDERSCGCQYIDTYGVLNPELPNYGRIPAIRLPKMPVPTSSCNAAMLVGSYDAVLPVGSYEVLPAINLPGFCEVFPQAMPCELPCPCQGPLPCQYVETCGYRMQNPIVEMSSPISMSVVQLPSCRCQSTPCGCQSVTCGCQSTPCECQNMPFGCPSITCGCQNMACGCQSTPCGCQKMPCGQCMPCGCQSMPRGSQNMPCGCQNCNCKCQNVIQYEPQLPALELPCACQTCQLSPVDVPVYGYSCQSLPPPVIGCGGKYLRQVTIQPPFL